MRILLFLPSLLFVFGFSVEETISSKIESDFVNNCNNDNKCISAVRSQIKSCIDNSHIFTYIKEDETRKRLNEYIGNIHDCIKDEDGKPIFQTIYAKNTSPLTETQKQQYFEICLEKANAGQNKYQYELGSLYLDGFGTKKNADNAYYWWQIAAENGNIEAQKKMGAAYILGPDNRQKYYPRDYEKAFNWYLKAAKSGDSSAQTVVGSLYHDGQGVEKSLQNAISWWEKAAAQGNEVASKKLKNITKHSSGTGQKSGLPLN